MHSIFQTKSLPTDYDYLAPDTSEIRLLAEFEGGGLSHCTLPAGKNSTAVKHKTVSEIWYCLSGRGEIWQKKNDTEETKQFTTGDSFTISVGNHFQFRNHGNEALSILIATIPKWPGPNEAEMVDGKW